MTGAANSSEQFSIRRSISEFQSVFEKECASSSLDNAVSSMADRNEIVHVYENYRSNMEMVLENVQNYRIEYEMIFQILWNYCETNKILK